MRLPLLIDSMFRSLSKRKSCLTKLLLRYNSQPQILPVSQTNQQHTLILLKTPRMLVLLTSTSLLMIRVSKPGQVSLELWVLLQWKSLSLIPEQGTINMQHLPSNSSKFNMPPMKALVLPRTQNPREIQVVGRTFTLMGMSTWYRLQTSLGDPVIEDLEDGALDHSSVQDILEVSSLHLNRWT